MELFYTILAYLMIGAVTQVGFFGTGWAIRQLKEWIQGFPEYGLNDAEFEELMLAIYKMQKTIIRKAYDRCFIAEEAELTFDPIEDYPPHQYCLHANLAETCEKCKQEQEDIY